MDKFDGRKASYIGDTEVVTTTEVCRLLGVKLFVKEIQELTGLEPHSSINGSMYWKTSDVPLIAAMLASELSCFAACFQAALKSENKTPK